MSADERRVVAVGDEEEFALLRTLAAAQRRGAELVARAELAVANIEARAAEEVEEALTSPAPDEFLFEELASEVAGLLTAARDSVTARLNALYARLDAACPAAPAL